MTRVHAGKMADWAENEQREVEVSGQSVLVLRHDGQFYALKNLCTHQPVPLLGGDVADGKITCAKHGGKFELATGKARALPAVKPVLLFKAEEENGEIYVSAL